MIRLIFLIGLLLSLGACSDQPSPQTDDTNASISAPRTEVLELGRRVYNFRCYFCHGYSGDAKTLATTYLSPRPRDFTKESPEKLGRDRMLSSITHGRPGTAMKGFADILQPHEIAAVTDFVRQEFMISKARNSNYHTKENGWPNHEQYAVAFPFATGKIPLDRPAQQLTPEQRTGRRLFTSTCISCHDRAKVDSEGAPWDSRPLSFPRNGFTPGDWPPVQVDGVASATPYHLHDKVPKIDSLTSIEKHGESLFQQNCAFCHAADGTGKNWIGSFLEPHPRDLTSSAFMRNVTKAHLANAIREGLPETSMPAWKSVLNDAEIQALIAYISRAFHPVAADAASASDNQ